MSSIKMAKISESLEECAEHIRSGHLVAFPTETVYGLGANALNPLAVQSIFLAKKRPLTDPIIVHITSWSEALPLISEPDQSIISVAHSLATKFWPGPLTLVLRHSPQISPILTAGTPFIGLRSPNHPQALSLISQSGCPIAAPSANLFSHVSPTKASHVFDDFHDSEFDIKILNGGQCTIGIESTVIKIINPDSGIEVQILRRGGISEENLISALGEGVKVTVKQNYSGVDVANEAPGQLIKHYSPNVECFLLENGESGEFVANVQETVLIEFGKDEDEGWRARIGLSDKGDVEESMQGLYDCLRWAEVQNGKIIVVKVENKLVGPLASALWDRIYRATSGRRVVRVGDNIYNKVN